MLTSSPRPIGILGILVAVVVILGACTLPDTMPFIPPEALEPITSAVEVAEAPAPIDNVEVLVDDSDPPQVSLIVSSGLPNSCYDFDRYEVNQEGDQVTVSIFNIEKKADVCAQVYTSVEHNIPLGGEFDSSKTYALSVNEFIDVFVVDELIAAAAKPVETRPAMAEPSTPSPEPEADATEVVEPEATPEPEPEPTLAPTPTPEPATAPEPVIEPTTEPEPELVSVELAIP